MLFLGRHDLNLFSEAMEKKSLLIIKNFVITNVVKCATWMSELYQEFCYLVKQFTSPIQIIYGFTICTK